MQMEEFMTQLSSKAPVPGGGGASALIGAVSFSLCSMVANLTTGKKKYVEFQPDIDRILEEVPELVNRMVTFIQKDAEVFEPLSRAYGIPKDEPEREEILENALKKACSVPMDILQELSNAIGIIEELSVKGSRLAISDVGVAASACRSAMEGAIMNVYVNTRLMKDKEYAEKLNAQAKLLLSDGVCRCDKVYAQVTNTLL